nr:MAG TPA: hypothetical protein [Caudoviricetes sp.]
MLCRYKDSDGQHGVRKQRRRNGGRSMEQEG